MTLASTGNVGIGYVDPGTRKLSINGNVGIGTTGPSDILHIAKAGNAWINLDVGATGRRGELHIMRGTGNDTYLGVSSADSFNLWTTENIPMRFAVNDDEEWDFSFKQNIKFIDLENKEEMTLNPLSIKETYIKNLKIHYKTLEDFAHRSNIDLHFFRTSGNFEDILYNYFIKRSSYI